MSRRDFPRFGALGCALLGRGHGAVFRDLLFRTAPSAELAVVPELAEALGDTLRREPGLGVVVPALDQGFAHHLDALRGRQGEQRERDGHRQTPRAGVAAVPSEAQRVTHLCPGGALGALLLLSEGQAFLL